MFITNVEEIQLSDSHVLVSGSKSYIFKADKEFFIL